MHRDSFDQNHVILGMYVKNKSHQQQDYMNNPPLMTFLPVLSSYLNDIGPQGGGFLKLYIIL